MLTQNRGGRRKSPVGLVVPWLVLVVAEQKRCCVSLSRCAHENNHSSGGQSGGSEGSQCLRAPSCRLEKPNRAFAGITISPYLSLWGSSQLAPADCYCMCVPVCVGGWMCG